MEASDKRKMKYGELKTETQFLKKMAADVISRFGDSLDAVAYSWMVYILTGSASLTAITYAVNTLVSVVLSPFTASLITNWNKKAVIVAGDVGRGVMVTATALLFIFNKLEPWMIITITALNSTLEAFRLPGGTAIMPKIVAREKYTLAVSLSGALSRGAELVGMVAAGVIVRFFGVSGALFIDVGTFLCSAAILATIKLPQSVRETVSNAFAEFVKNTKEGFLYALKHDVVLAICAGACFLNFALAPFTALITAYVNESLHLTATALSVIGVANTAGIALGSLSVPRLLGKVKRFTLLFTGVLLISIGFLALSVVPRFSYEWKWVSLAVVMFVMGNGMAFANTVVQVALMEKISEEYLARVMGIFTSICMAAMPVASFLSAGLANFMGVSHILLIFGILAVIATVVSLFIKPFRKL